MFKKRARKNKNTRFYTGSPFLKGYIQSLTNKQGCPLNKIQILVYSNTNSRTQQEHITPNSNQATEPHSKSQTNTDTTVYTRNHLTKLFSK